MVSAKRVESRRAGHPAAIGPQAVPVAASVWPVVGEWLRRGALALLAALIVIRLTFPSDAPTVDVQRSGVIWDGAMLGVTLLALLAGAVGGATRWRWSAVDACVIAGMILLAFSTRGALDGRAALNGAWNGVGVGLAYLLARCLPRDARESRGLASALAAAAVGLAAYGLVQVALEFPETRARYQANPQASLLAAGIDPTDPASVSRFENRLLGSREPFATFALANSLAGLLVGVAAIGLAALFDHLTRPRSFNGSAPGETTATATSTVSVLIAAIPLGIVLTCLLLTKSRSAYLGLLVAGLVWLWRASKTRRGGALGAVVVGSAVLGALAVATGAATGQLDRLIVTESFKSLSYRLDYWRGAWGILTGEEGVFWTGLGPNNFAPAYPRWMTETASEEIADPHNFVLEAWCTAGLFGMVATLAGLGWGLRHLLGPGQGIEEGRDDPEPLETVHAAAPRSGWWLVVAAAFGWVLALAINPTVEERRLVVLLAGFGGAVLLGRGLAMGNTVGSAALGLGVLAVAVNLLAAGGLGFPSVALPWAVWLAVGQNLRQDRRCGRLRVAGRLPAVTGLLIWAAVVGIYVGTIGSFLRSEALLEAAERLASRASRPEEFDRPLELALEAAEADRLSARPWTTLAQLTYARWIASGAQEDRNVWVKALTYYDMALEPPRDPRAGSILREQARMGKLFLERLGESISPNDRLVLLGRIAKATRLASRLAPTRAGLRAELAGLNADLSLYDQAVAEAEEALRLDAATPHADRKLDDARRRFLQDALPRWREAAAKPRSRDGGGSDRPPATQAARESLHSEFPTEISSRLARWRIVHHARESS